MSSDNSFNTIKKLPETVKQFIGLIFLTLVIKALNVAIKSMPK